MTASDCLDVLIRFFGQLPGLGSFEPWFAPLRLRYGDVLSSGKLDQANIMSWERVDFLTS